MRDFDRALAALLAVAGLLAVAAASSTPLKNVEPPPARNPLLRDEDVEYRLGDELIPSNYKIKITPQFVNGNAETFTGEVVINAIVQKETENIRLHKAVNIDMNEDDIKVILKGSGQEELDKQESVVNTIPEFYMIRLKEAVPINSQIEIRISYTAKFPEGLYGFYKSTYPVTLENGEKSEDVLFTTQFQPTHARKAFPCFDEPRFKATFDVTVVVPSGYNALSNTPNISTNLQTGEVVFDTTPKMSTYLLAFLVYKEDTFSGTSTASGDLPFRTWARHDEIAAGGGELSQTDGPLIIKQMEDFTNIPYTDYAKKIDQAAIPDFSFGAMENWGLVTYRETALLYHKSEHTQAAKRRVSELIAHELAHQWFGNLVTTEWWSTAWLNEGFATYFEYYITDKLHPKWRMMERLVVDEQLTAFNADASAEGTALTTEVNTADEVIGHFGTITYSKGGSVVRMFSNILGEEKFKTALRNYLSDNAGDVATPQKLFDALTEAAGESSVNLNAVFESWTTSVGFPVVSVSREESQITFTQVQFQADGASGRNKYDIHLHLISNDESYAEQSTWFLKGSDKAFIDEAPANGSWLLVPTTGYFRVNYDEENWALLTAYLHGDSDNRTRDEELIEPIERGILIDNALNLARANKLDYSIAIELLSYLEHELDFIPWSVAFSGLNYLYRMLKGNGDTIERFILHITSNVYEELGFEVVNANDDDSHIEHIHRANVLNWACRAGHPDCTAKAVEHLQNYLINEESVKVTPDLRSVVYCYGVKHDVTLWPRLYKKLAETDDATERSLLFSALGCSTTSSTLYMYLESTIIRGTVRIQDITSVFSGVYSNPEGVDIALAFLEYNLQEIQERTSTTMNGLSNIIKGIGQNINKVEQRDKLVRIAAQLTSATLAEAVKTALTSAEVNLAWLTMHKDNVLNELEKAMTVPPPVPTTTEGAAWALRPAALALILSVALPAFALLL